MNYFFERKKNSYFAAVGFTLFFSLVHTQSFASDEKTDNVNTRVFSSLLGASRLVYPTLSNGISVSVENTQEYPVLIQSKIQSEGFKPNIDFLITPPLFKLEGGEKSQVRIVRVGGNFPNDRETLEWFCIKTLPPSTDSLWAKQNSGKSAQLGINVVVNNCIKLFVRPESLTGSADSSIALVKWNLENGKLYAKNETPYYVNLSSVRINGQSLKTVTHLSPFSSLSFNEPFISKEENIVQWDAINQYGGVSDVHLSKITP